MAPNHALIFGASGITGWAIINQLLQSNNSDANQFSRVTALTNRPLDHKDTLWPSSEKLLLTTANIMHANGQAGLEAELSSKVKDVGSVTHVYFFAYIMDPEPEKEIEINVKMLSQAISVVENLSKNLKFVVLPTGTKAYGVHLIEKFPFKDQLPLSEIVPRIPEPYASQMFYYNQTDWLAKACEGKSWTWCEVIPDVIIGFVPNNNIYCLPQTLALYLSLYRHKNGHNATVPFPGTFQSWKIKSNDSPQDLIASFSIHASLHPETCGQGKRFNTALSTPSSWEQKWPLICAYFGLKGVAPASDGSAPQPTQYLEDNVEDWKVLEHKYGLVSGRVGNSRSYGGFPYFIMTMFDFDRQLDLSRTKQAWKASEGVRCLDDAVEQGWYAAFDRFKAAGIIPEFK